MSKIKILESPLAMLIKFGVAGLKLLPQRKKRAQSSQRLKKSRVVMPGVMVLCFVVYLFLR